MMFWQFFIAWLTDAKIAIKILIDILTHQQCFYSTEIANIVNSVTKWVPL
jgi:hypothetical protein